MTNASGFAQLRHLAFILLLCLLVRHNLLASELRFSHLNRTSGLSQGSVTALGQDSFGFLWIGTEDGLFRYDGTNLKSFRSDPDKLTSLQDNVITALIIDPENRVWVGSESDGLSYYDHNKDQFTRLEQTLTGTTIKQLFSGKFIAGAVVKSDLGLFQVAKNDQITRLLPPDQSNKVISVYADSSEKLQAVLDTGELLTIDLTTMSINPSNLVNSRNLQVWSIASCENLLLAEKPDEEARSVFYCHKDNETTYSPLNSLLTEAGLDPAELTISDIAESDDGTIWIATQSGLIKIDKGILSTSKHLPYDELSLSSNKLSKLLIGKETLFIGTEYDGLNLLKFPTSEFLYFNLLNTSKGYSHSKLSTKNETCGTVTAVDYDTVWTILKDSDGDLWVGNDYGLAIRKNADDVFSDFSRLGTSSDFVDLCSVWSLAEADGLIWIGIWGGLISLDKSTGNYTHYQPEASANDDETLSGKFVRILLHDKSRNSLWIGTNSKGLNRLDLSTNKITKYPVSPNRTDSLPHGRIRSIYLDPDNQLWVGTGGGLSLWEESTDTFKTLPSSAASTDLSDEDVRAINYYKDNYFWIGTGNGINLFNSKTFEVETRLNEKDGLVNSTVYSMVPDNAGRYWITTANGLSLFNPETLTFDNYSYHDGLQSNEFNFNAWHKSDNGTIYVGGVSGLNVIKPATYKSETTSASQIVQTQKYMPVVTSVTGTDTKGNKKTFGRLPVNGTEFRIPPSFRNLEFSYTIPAFGKESTPLGQHQLVQNKDSWSALKSQPLNPTYTNIKPGKYSFQIRSDSESSGTAHFPIYLEPYLWERFWFRAVLALLSFGLLGAAINHYNKKRLSASLDALTRQHYHILEHELRPHLYQANSNIQALSNSPTTLQKDKDFIESSINPLMDKSLSFLVDVRNLVDFKKAVMQPKMEYMLEDVVDEVILFFKDDHHRIDLNTIEDINIYTHQDAVYLLILNLVSNALKFSDTDAQIQLNLTTDQTNLIIECKDTGIGISENQQDHIYESYSRLQKSRSDIGGLGLGLSIVKHIVHTYNGSIQIKDNTPKGSCFMVVLKGVVSNG